MLNEMFLEVLGLSVMGSVMALLILAIKVVLSKHRGSVKKLAFVILWMMVFLRLSVPFTIDSDLFNFSSDRVNPTQFVYQAVVPKQAAGVEETPSDAVHNRQTDDKKSSLFQPNSADADRLDASLMKAEKRADMIFVAAFLWIAAAVLFLGVKALMYISVLSKVRRLQDLDYRGLDALKQAAGIKRTVILKQSRGEVNTAVYGIWKPIIVISKSSMIGIEHVLMHELVHVKRNDNLKKVFAEAVLAFHWFNPFVWISRYFLHKDIELACDETVISLLGYDERKAYAQSIIAFAVQHKGACTEGFASFGQNPIKGRIKNILLLRKKCVMRPLIALALMLFFVMGCMTNPISQILSAYAMESSFTELPIEDSTMGNITYYAVSGDQLYYLLAPQPYDEKRENILPGYRLAMLNMKTNEQKTLLDEKGSSRWASQLHYASGRLFYSTYDAADEDGSSVAIMEYNLGDGGVSQIAAPYENAKQEKNLSAKDPSGFSFEPIQLYGDDHYVSWHELYKNDQVPVEDYLIIWDVNGEAVNAKLPSNGNQSYANILDGYIAYQRDDELTGKTSIVRRQISTGKEIAISNMLAGAPYSAYANENYIVYKEDFRPGAKIVVYDADQGRNYLLWKETIENPKGEKLQDFTKGVWGINLIKDKLILTGASDTILEVDLSNHTFNTVSASSDTPAGFYRTKVTGDGATSIQARQEKDGSWKSRLFYGKLVQN